MILYGMWVGGVMGCCGVRKDGKQCRNRGYTTDTSRGYWCPWHEAQRDQQNRPD
ncbi:hypothetical protein SEA_SONALI_92 [Arthrobacter phage Sonali]|uniref:Uncharacterized protein n=1 Tax=Arthrobacter phage Sonali TaxID=2510495 RepID=A0A411CQK6_9CAUD|nr:hypothetical protein HOV09_gp92 [Arthrobacter phage Sonali]QAY16204.1 hypothetical protein SEA_SONALI_92 [Arthrobacter phage Sonali]